MIEFKLILFIDILYSQLTTFFNRYESTITAQFFGHTHFDEFELFYDTQNLGRPVGIAYVGPSVTPYYDLNPGYRIYYVDGDREHSTRVMHFQLLYRVSVLTHCSVFAGCAGPRNVGDEFKRSQFIRLSYLAKIVFYSSRLQPPFVKTRRLGRVYHQLGRGPSVF